MFHPLQVQNAGTLTEIKVRALLIMNHVPTGVGRQPRQGIAQLPCRMHGQPPWAGFQRVGFWHRAALFIMLAQPSSSPIESVFSMLKTVVDDRRVKACKIAKQHL